jgi:hypothetical protein
VASEWADVGIARTGPLFPDDNEIVLIELGSPLDVDRRILSRCADAGYAVRSAAPRAPFGARICHVHIADSGARWR